MGMVLRTTFNLPKTPQGPFPHVETTFPKTGVSKGHSFPKRAPGRSQSVCPPMNSRMMEVGGMAAISAGVNATI